MSQNDFNIANQGFPSFRSDLNSALQALASNSAGAAEPSTTYAYQFWYDETNELLKMRNSDNDAWITIGTFDQVADTFTPAGVTTDKIEEGNSSVEVVDTGTGYVAITVDGVEAARVDASGNLGIGTTSPNTELHVSTTGTTAARITAGAANSARIEFGDTDDEDIGQIQYYNSDNSMRFIANASERMRIDSSGRVGIGTSSPSYKLNIKGDNSASGGILLQGSAGSYGLQIYHDGPADTSRIYNYYAGPLLFGTNNTERMRIDSSGNLLLSATTTTGFQSSSSERGVILYEAGGVASNTANDVSAVLNRQLSDGIILQFKKDGSTVGGIGTNGSTLYIGSPEGTDAYLRFGNDIIGPATSTGAFRDNAIDLGFTSGRFDDIYATNGTIQTSDRNEKQDIEALSDAEQRVAVAAKGLLRKYRWKDAVAEKGDAARIHFGIIAQDLQAAFEAEGLDAGRYGMFISSTWWEADRVIPAVEAVAAQDAVYETVVIPAVLDEDGNEIEPERTEQVLVSEAVEAVEAQPERTVTDTFETQEEAPEGAVERTRLGVRYPELLAFIIAAI